MKYNFVKYSFLPAIILFSTLQSKGHDYWQQKVEYSMEVDFDVKKHQFTGDQTLVYFNNSSDTLFNVYYHLYFNAFQPGSMMDVRSRTIEDPDGRVGSRIAALTDDEIGYLKVSSLNQNGIALSYEVSETVLEVKLAEPILPGAKATFSMKFNGQVPVQIRRSGRFNLGGVDYSMAQWFPKMAEYDEMGWHTAPYVGREFYAPWGNYDVKITIDKDYVVAATGILQNKNEIGYGYEDEGVTVKRKGKNITYHFKATNVHDFVWAADPEYTQLKAQVPDGPLVRFFYIPGEETVLWEQLPEYTVKAFQYANEHFGKYGWDEYAVIQGGDGGMEYPMATLIANKRSSGVRSLKSLIGVTFHEMMHSWYQGMLATNESLYPWMDEGYTSFAESYISNDVLGEGKENPIAGSYRSYIKWALGEKEEAISTHADHFNTNRAYSVGSYTKGSVSLEQLSYIIGKEARDKGLLRYYNEWAFKHPDLNDFVRVMEKQSGIELDWYYEYWVNTTKTIDYAVNAVISKERGSSITLERIGLMPMPVELVVTKKDGSQIMYYMPLTIMRGEKPNESKLERITLKDWPWTHPTYSFDLDIPISDIAKIEIDPEMRMADIDKENNVYQLEEVTVESSDKTNK
ncbi:MAG: peptidase M1 [Flammeovirgaceae bacterium]|nr:peptidase M1 [Flammeovirgaceae bacterium]MBR07846.1 peptidase M1 [Rickettsiales bacterium]|tara:strand:- start:9385 stop:11271 length:1887 start_codon:yes stop_codon:yes gene_type:complete